MAKKKVFQISNALTEGLEETVSAAHGYSGTLRVEVIALKKLELDPDNPRDLALTFDDLIHGIERTDRDYNRKISEKESLASLANSIVEQGLINPILVYKHGDKYRLVAGERRTLASILADKSDIQAKILERKPNELKISQLQWMENVERKDLSLAERLKNLSKIIYSYYQVESGDYQNLRASDLSKLLGCSLPHAMNYVSVLKADSRLQELIQVNKIKNLEKASVLAAIKDVELKNSAIQACIDGVSLKKLKLMGAEKRAPVKPVVHQAKQPGRQTAFVKFGQTKKIPVAKFIIDSILQNEKSSHLSDYVADINWNDYKAVNNAFKFLLKRLEEVEA